MTQTHTLTKPSQKYSCHEKADRQVGIRSSSGKQRAATVVEDGAAVLTNCAHDSRVTDETCSRRLQGRMYWNLAI